MNIGDYAVVQHERRRQLVKVTSVGKRVGGILVGGLPYSDSEVVEFDLLDVQAVLGPRPQFGNAYGVKIEPFLKTFDHDYWGAIHYFTRLSKPQRECLNRALDKAALSMKHVLSFCPIDIEIRHAKGKYSGLFTTRRRGEEVQNIMTLKPKDDWTLASYLYVIYHELGHGIWNNMMTDKAKARWIRAYWSTVKLTNAQDKQIKRLHAEFVKSGEGLLDFRRGLEDDTRTMFDACLAYIRNYHALTPRELHTLWQSGDTFDDLWPKSQLELFDQEPLISEYGMKSVEEFFAEAHAFHYMKKKLPRSIQPLLDKTLSTLVRR